MPKKDLRLIKTHNWINQYMYIKYLVFVFIALISGCDKSPPKEFKVINSAALNQLMQQQAIFLVDVHTPEQRHIKGTDAFVPFDKIEQFQDRFPVDKNTPIYLYCQGGPMGESAAKKLYDLGYRNISNLNGGANAWQKDGFAFE